MKSFLNFLFIFSICASFLSCSQSDGVVSKHAISKRKYNKGFHVNIGAFQKRDQAAQSSHDRRKKPEPTTHSFVEPSGVASALPKVELEKTDPFVNIEQDHHPVATDDNKHDESHVRKSSAVYKTIDKVSKKLNLNEQFRSIEDWGEGPSNSNVSLGWVALALGIATWLFAVIGLIPSLFGLGILSLAFAIGGLVTGILSRDTVQGKIGMILSIVYLALILLLVLLIVLIILAIGNAI